MRQIHKVAVLGAGTMGARIALHFANAGVPSFLLDMALGQRGGNGAQSGGRQRTRGGAESQARSLV